MKSIFFITAKPGTPGRRLARHLNEKKVMLAQIASANPEHQHKFTPRWRTRKLEEAK